jgi:pyruvate dehydrogenase E2 component (dihydrolipoamide acetyltransferase)
MPIVSVRIPQIGEGLQEARLVAVLKQPGEFVKRDEPIYQMETDKAVMDVESPYEGILTEWLAPVDTILAIGAEVAKMDVGVAAEQDAAPAHRAPAPTTPAAAAAAEDTIGVRIPQIGEGLQEARLVAVLKQPGEWIKRDEPIYQMETDKAVMDVESPYEGTLVEWLAEVDTVLPIGAEVMRMRVVGAVPAVEPVHGHAPTAASAAPAAAATSSPSVVSTGPLRNEVLPPRSRAYAAERGLSADDLAALAARVGKIMPSDIDAFLPSGPAAPTSTVKAPSAGGPYQETAMNQKQRLLASRLVRGSQLVVPGSMTVAMNWEPIENLRGAYKARGGDFQPSSFTMFAYAAVQALKEFPAFRSSLKGDDTIRTYDQVNLGVAVALPGDELVIAVVDGACQLSWTEFANKLRERIELARNGTDQAHEGVSVSLTNMQAHGIRDAVAVVVPPAVATVFLGEPYWGVDPAPTDQPKFQRCANLGITFDHRIINGVGAAQFQNRIKQFVETISGLITVE